MRSRTTRRFWELFDALPIEVQDQARGAYVLFQNDPWHNSLRFKKVEDTIPLYSARVGIKYRAVGKRDGDIVTWFWIGSHAEYERLLRS